MDLTPSLSKMDSLMTPLAIKSTAACGMLMPDCSWLRDEAEHPVREAAPPVGRADDLRAVAAYDKHRETEQVDGMHPSRSPELNRHRPLPTWTPLNRVDPLGRFAHRREIRRLSV